MLSNEYVAGIFDGEGCVTTSRQFIKGKYEKYPRVRMQVCIANCHTGLLEEITKWFGGGYTDKNGKNKKMPCFSWRITGKENMTNFLNCIRPHTIVKSKQIDLALMFCQTLRGDNLGCKPLLKATHELRDMVHFGLRELKATGS